MSAINFRDLSAHVGHKIVCVGYKPKETTQFMNVALECETCNEVLLDFENDLDESD